MGSGQLDANIPLPDAHGLLTAEAKGLMENFVAEQMTQQVTERCYSLTQQHQAEITEMTRELVASHKKTTDQDKEISVLKAYVKKVEQDAKEKTTLVDLNHKLLKQIQDARTTIKDEKDAKEKLLDRMDEADKHSTTLKSKIQRMTEDMSLMTAAIGNMQHHDSDADNAPDWASGSVADANDALESPILSTFSRDVPIGSVRSLSQELSNAGIDYISEAGLASRRASCTNSVQSVRPRAAFGFGSIRTVVSREPRAQDHNSSPTASSEASTIVAGTKDAGIQTNTPVEPLSSVPKTAEVKDEEVQTDFEADDNAKMRKDIAVRDAQVQTDGVVLDEGHVAKAAIEVSNAEVQTHLIAKDMDNLEMASGGRKVQSNPSGPSIRDTKTQSDVWPRAQHAHQPPSSAGRDSLAKRESRRGFSWWSAVVYLVLCYTAFVNLQERNSWRMANGDTVALAWLSRGSHSFWAVALAQLNGQSLDDLSVGLLG